MRQEYGKGQGKKEIKQEELKGESRRGRGGNSD